VGERCLRAPVVGKITHMGNSGGLPTWQLVLVAAGRLGGISGEFRMQDLIGEVQRLDPARGRGSIQPVIQGMTVNAAGGPSSPCGKPLVRTGHGVYRIADSEPPGGSETSAARLQAPSPARAPRMAAGRDAEVARRVAAVSRDFADCLAAYDRQVPFARSGQYEWHRMTIEARMRCGSVRAALDDEAFPRLLHGTLQRWGIGRRASVLVPLAEFRQRLRDQAGPLAALENARIDDPALDVPAVRSGIWRVIGSLGIVRNHSLIVPGTKTMHHLLPDLVPPMDRAWTGAFFLWSAAAPQYAQEATFTRTFTGLTQIARDVQSAGYTGGGWRTSRSKVLDNAIIGYCRLSQIPPVRT
jgi:hypothetical protein